MKILSLNRLAAAVLLSAVCVGAGAINYASTPAASGTSIQWVNGDSTAAATLTSATTATESAPAEVRHANALSEAFRNASQRVMPSVVTIQSVARKTQVSAQAGQIPEELRDHPMFKRFFEGMPEQPRRAPGGRQRSGMGSGVIVDASGIILTNNHVVDGAEGLMVKLHDGRQFEAKDWVTDPKTDIAVVRIESTSSLPVATIGDSDAIQIGDWVIAVGAPFGLDKTVTAGIISAKSRGIGITAREEFLQTDAAINPGNSGGPLVNLNGEVVGINTAISTTNGGYQGIGFAVPVNLARWVGDELMAHGTVQRAFLGVGIQAVDNALSQQLGLNAVRGAVVTDVRSDSPAARAGLQSGDVVLEFNGATINTPSDLQGRVERASLKDTHKLVVMRDGKTITLNVRVELMPATLLAADSTMKASPSQSEFDDVGLNVADLTADVAQQLGMDGVNGVVITAVDAGSPAAAAGLNDGMVIRKVGSAMVTTVEEFEAAMAASSLQDGILLLVRNGEASQFVVVKS